jgi:hypothetical protein
MDKFVVSFFNFRDYYNQAAECVILLVAFWFIQHGSIWFSLNAKGREKPFNYVADATFYSILSDAGFISYSEWGRRGFRFVLWSKNFFRSI